MHRRQAQACALADLLDGEEGSNMRCWMASSMPQPLSDTTMATLFADSAWLVLVLHSARLLRFTETVIWPGWSPIAW